MTVELTGKALKAKYRTHKPPSKGKGSQGGNSGNTKVKSSRLNAAEARLVKEAKERQKEHMSHVRVTLVLDARGKRHFLREYV